MFRDSLDEFNDAEDVVRCLVDEYAAAEHSSYVEWGQESNQSAAMEGM